MFRIRRVLDDVLPSDRAAIAQVQEILRTQFTALPAKDIAKLPDQLHNPLRYRFRFILFVAEDARDHVKAFALLSHEAALRFCYLDFLSAELGKTGRGTGGVLYERVREEALSLKTRGLFFECHPDDPNLVRDPELLKQNIARLRFYERFGARPIIGTEYETPLKPEDLYAPHLVYDDLRQHIRLRRTTAKAIVRAILEGKYGSSCPPGYIDKVVNSFKDDPVRLRKPRYFKKEPPIPVRVSTPEDKRIALVINDQHAIHHVRE